MLNPVYYEESKLTCLIMAEQKNIPVKFCLFLKLICIVFIATLNPQNKQQQIKRETKADEEKVCLLGHHWLQRACDSLGEQRRHKGSERQNEKEGDGSTCDLGRLRIRVAVCCPKGKKGLAHYFRRVTLVFTTRRINRNAAVQAAQVITVQNRLTAHYPAAGRGLSVSGNGHLLHSFCELAPYHTNTYARVEI